jgi:hypothetical protein
MVSLGDTCSSVASEDALFDTSIRSLNEPLIAQQNMRHKLFHSKPLLNAIWSREPIVKRAPSGYIFGLPKSAFDGSIRRFFQMAIKPKCDACRKELKDFGAIVLSPPNKRNSVQKYHLC